MAKIIQNIKIPLDENLEEHLAWLYPDHGEFRVMKKSLDARKRHQAHFVYTVEIANKNEVLPRPSFELEKVTTGMESAETAAVKASQSAIVMPAQHHHVENHHKPIIIGSGPAGLFAALRLVERGIPCRLFERGSKSDLRIKGINQFWRYGKLDPRNNVCFGEGGAGLYSDGKLITRIKSPHIPYVLNRLVQFGAPQEIEYLSNPHVGSDRIRRVIPKMREFLIHQGCEIHYDTKVEKLSFSKDSRPRITGIITEKGEEFAADQVILATGHSAEDMLYHLHDSGVHMEGKSFAMGLRVEHSQSLVNQIQYRELANHPQLSSANYKLTYHDHEQGLGVYSFCMCPGGYVLSSGTEEDRVVVNGMSNYARNSPYANAAIVISIDHAKLFGSDVFGGMKLREAIERKAYLQGRENQGSGRELPTQNLISFLRSSPGKLIPAEIKKGSSPSGEVEVNFHDILPVFMTKNLIEAFQSFDKSMKGFITPEAQLYGVESRTSCPLRVTRDEATLQSISHAGLYPAGEGAGYAGGITSAACDGIRIADKIFESY